ncbi:MAG: MFS transporter [Kineosporiaceae bacterium]
MTETARPTGPTDPAGVLAPPQRAALRLATVGVVSLVTMVAFESMAVATAMPDAAADLGGVRGYGLAFSLFLTTSLFGTVVSGPWADRVGPRQPLLVGIVAFVGGLLVCTTALSFGALLVGRAVSGAGGGLIVVALYVVVARVYPADAQPRVFSWISTAWVLPAVVGPPVAGLLTEHLTWRLVFGLVPLVVVLPLVTLWPRLPHGPAPTASGPGPADADAALVARHDADRGADQGADDVPGIGARERLLRGALLATSAALLQAGLQGATLLGVPAAVTAVLGGAGVLASLPGLVPPGVLRVSRGVPSLVVARLLLAAAFFGAEAFVPLMLVAERGWGVSLAGASLTSSAIGWAAGSWLQGHARLPVPRHLLVGAGGGVLGVAVGLLALTPWPQAPGWSVAAVWTLGGFGMGAAISAISVLTLQLSRDGEEGRNSGAVQLGDALGGVLGIGASGAVFAHGHTPGVAEPGLYSLIWLVLAPLALLVGVVAVRMREDDAPEVVHRLGRPGVG